MGPAARLAVMVAAWIAWLIPFFVNRSRGQGVAVRMDPRARTGILLVAAGFFIANTHGPRVWDQPLEAWRAVAALLAGLAAIALTWTSVGNLGKQWRIEAGLNADHQLIQTGAYRIVRHPIYLSILLMLLMNIAFVGTLPGWPAGIVLAVIGTEIRVRVEDSLLLDRFGESFASWKKQVPAYLPFIR